MMDLVLQVSVMCQREWNFKMVLRHGWTPAKIESAPEEVISTVEITTVAGCISWVEISIYLFIYLLLLNADKACIKGLGATCALSQKSIHTSYNY